MDRSSKISVFFVDSELLFKMGNVLQNVAQNHTIHNIKRNVSA